MNIKQITTALIEECARQKAQLFLWMPVFLGLGIGLYFSLLSEPPIWLALVLLAALIVPALLFRGRAGLSEIMLLLLMVVLGFLAAQVRTNVLYTPVIKKEIGPVAVTGTIEMLEDLETGKGRRLLLRDLEIEKLLPEQTPRKIRLTAKKGEYATGQRVKVLAKLNPPSPPVAPGAFDFQRHLFFQGIGAVGFVFKELEPPQETNARNYIEELRIKIAQRMEKQVDPLVAPMAIAFTNGQRTEISAADNDAMRDSGLFHLISISGLHIGIFSAFVFFVSRLFMACIPGMALKHPIKKYAAVLGFLAAAFYTMLAGASIPTQRSLIMVGMAYLAIILDRSPISLRLVAFAALVVLVVAPESLVSVSFQMSFAAVAALVVFFDWLRPYWAEWNRRPGWLIKIALYIFSICMTTVIATLATAPFSLFHFQQLALYGLPANALAVPITSFIIMPAIVLTLLTMPFHMEYLPLKVLEWGMSLVLSIAHKIAELPHGVLLVEMWPHYALVLTVIGLIIFGLWQGRFRFAGIMPVIAALVMVAAHKPPEIHLSQKFDLAAYRDSNDLYVSGRRKNKFSIEAWERMYGLSESAAKTWPKEGQEGAMNCDERACRLEIEGQRVSFLKKPQFLNDECAWATIVFSFDVLDSNTCADILVRDKLDGYKYGAHALWLNPIKLETVEEYRGQRPWVNSSLRPRP
jgi:competence protein ComEC